MELFPTLRTLATLGKFSNESLADIIAESLEKNEAWCRGLKPGMIKPEWRDLIQTAIAKRWLERRAKQRAMPQSS